MMSRDGRWLNLLTLVQFRPHPISELFSLICHSVRSLKFIRKKIGAYVVDCVGSVRIYGPK